MKQSAIAMLFLSIVCGCTKMSADPLMFKMNGRLYSFSAAETAFAESDCQGRVYQITACYGDAHFKINWTAAEKLTPGVFLMGESATNAIPGTATFWYTNQGSSYTARPFTLTVHSYSNRHVKASFTGGVVTDGYLNILIDER